MTTDHDVAFPTLAPEDLAELETRGRRREVRAGEVLFHAGVRNFRFYAVLDGAIDIVDTSREEEPLVATHRAGQFTGDVDMLTGRVAVVTARAAEDSRLRLSRCSPTRYRRACPLCASRNGEGAALAGPCRFDRAQVAGRADGGSRRRGSARHRLGDRYRSEPAW